MSNLINTPFQPYILPFHTANNENPVGERLDTKLEMLGSLDPITTLAQALPQCDLNSGVSRVRVAL